MNVLDKTGYVELVDKMGSDDSIVEAARISYGKNAVKSPAVFIRNLWKNGHTSPFEQVVLKYRLKTPIFVARQIMRHRTARINEASLRYSESSLEFYFPSDCDVSLFRESCEKSAQTYKKLLEMEVPKEKARAVLPLALYTEFFFQIDLHNLFHFLELRMSKHAQKETREYASAMFSLAKEVAPLACAAFAAKTNGD